MSLLWGFFVFMCMIGSVLYNVAFKLADGHINPFVFACALTGVGLIGHLFCLAFYKFHMGEAVTLNVDKTGILMAVMAGVGIVIVDLAFFFAIRHGGIVSTNIVWSVGVLILTGLAGYFIFKEPMSYTKLLGMLFGLLSVILLSKSKG
jgi:drug/metabolite transporter (DMT)-like permease